jgi:hypothetical protein
MLMASVLPKGNTFELIKVPSMVKHLQSHVTDDGLASNFLESLVIHYSLGSDHYEPSHEDELPFVGVYFSGSPYIFNKFEVALTTLPLSAEPHTLEYVSLYSFLQGNFLLQPPRA